MGQRGAEAGVHPPDPPAATISWCQGFSEPDAGSDLASLSTKAELDGDEWVINGQKVWTTQAQYADYIFLLARTDPEAKKHAGISYLLVPMRPTGDRGAPDRTGRRHRPNSTRSSSPTPAAPGTTWSAGVDNGWKVAMTTLGFERGSSATTGHRRFARELDAILAEARAAGRTRIPLIRQRLARAWSKVKIMEINGYRTLTDSLNGTRHAAALGACNKMFWSETHQQTMELAMDILGLDGQSSPGRRRGRRGHARRRAAGRTGYPVGDLQASFFFSRSETIWGGTAQIQRNIVGERVLGLPKEPAP